MTNEGGKIEAYRRRVDEVFGWFLVLLGCVHNFIAAPAAYDTLTSAALWFVSAGLALWYAGFLNVLHARARKPEARQGLFVVLTNLSLLAFVISFALLRDNWRAPESWALIGAVTWLSATTLASLLKRASGTRR